MIHELLHWRSRLVANLTGTILEIGTGHIPNLPHYQNATHNLLKRLVGQQIT